jgi:hypothetical protein
MSDVYITSTSDKHQEINKVQTSEIWGTAKISFFAFPLANAKAA